jgi:hypothetical protein
VELRASASDEMDVRMREKRSARDMRRALRSCTFWRPVMKRVGQVGQVRTWEAMDIASRTGWRVVGKEKVGSIVARFARVR